MKVSLELHVITILLIATNLNGQIADPVQTANETQLWTEEALISHWSKFGIDKMEGIYKEINNPTAIEYSLTPYVYAILKTSPNQYQLIGIISRGGPVTQQNCHIQATFNGSPDFGNFKSIWENCGYPDGYRNISIYKNGITIESPSSFDWEFQKQIIDIPIHSNKSSGTGFAISSSGIIVTNYHVIENATTIMIRGINNDFHQTYQASLLYSDKTNDLVLLKINDKNFTTLDSIPYIIKNDLSVVGENIFILGYPLLATMGEEIKLTNGIISSKTGFQGNITTYQISAPVQPGNSGGPLFNSKGEIIGIVSAKHILTENVTYAIKSNLLYNLIQLIPNPPIFRNNISLSSKTLSEQVETVKYFVYIIECE